MEEEIINKLIMLQHWLLRVSLITESSHPAIPEVEEKIKEGFTTLSEKCDDKGLKILCIYVLEYLIPEKSKKSYIAMSYLVDAFLVGLTNDTELKKNEKIVKQEKQPLTIIRDKRKELDEKPLYKNHLELGVPLANYPRRIYPLLLNYIYEKLPAIFKTTDAITITAEFYNNHPRLMDELRSKSFGSIGYAYVYHMREKGMVVKVANGYQKIIQQTLTPENEYAEYILQWCDKKK